MLPALPVDKISARGPDMASAGRDKSASEKTRRTRVPTGEPNGRGPAKQSGGPPNADETAGQLPVRAGEERWSVEELSAVRGRLEEEIGKFGDEIARAESEIAERMGDSSEGAGDDQADAGAKTYEREHEMALTYNARDLLAQNERAVARIDAGTYGICESCGKPIGKARLQAFPRATLCVTCKQREERR
ncbi:MAG: conjugal transfer protein TraR [Streptosporangiaceae bacterium]|jgi:DnaK suppressor protein|nr:conjugal transfer protein TraR [Streptosporangiaceae bacterium]